MKKHSFGRRFLSLLLVFAMALSVAPISAFAAVGDLSNVDTGLTGDIDTGDTISLPIKILDYEADGMLFEYAEAYAGTGGNAAAKTASDFGATWYTDFTNKSAIGDVTNSMFGNFWSDVTTSLNTSNSYASRLRVTYNETTASNGGCYYGRASVITPNDLGGKSMDSIRYLVMVYRSNVTSGKIGFWVERANLTTRTSANNRVGDLTFTSDGSTNWTYAVYDLKQGNLASTWSSYGNANAVFTTLPLDSSGDWMDIAHIALFANKDQAEAFGEYALTDGSNRGDNRGFGLLRGSRNQGDAGTTASNGLGSAFPGIFKYNNTSADYGNAAATVYQVPWNTSSTLDLSTVTNLGYQLLGTYDMSNIANIGLLESSIGSNGYPVYKEEVVTYMAYLLKHSLEIPERTSDGWKNYRYVKGTASSVYGNTDLATALRNAIDDKTITNGDCDAAAGKNLVGAWSDVSGNISTYHDAAYFLLNSIFVPGSYNVPQDDYNYLILSAGTDSVTGDKVYVFDGGFSTSATPSAAQMAINYDTTNKTIQNTSAAGKAHIVYEGDNTTTLYPFLPVLDRNTESGMTITPYYQDDGVINAVKKQEAGATLYKRNYGFAMVSEGEFVYHADDELFFDFEGDDDVYLFINGELVMDIGSAHSIDGVRFELNDYVNAAKAGTLGSTARNKALALEEGNTYSFKFYYMERHSYGSNIRISTNIRVTDPSMQTAKPAWQNGTQLDFGSIVDKDKVVEYGFAITNNGEENLYNLTFTDNDIGVTLDYTNGLKVTGSRVYDVNGGTLEASDLTAVVSHPNYADINVTFADNAALKKFLTDLTASGTEEGGGLYIGATVQIRGIGYKLSTAQINAGVFDNTVLTTSTNKTKSETLHGQATMRVFVPADPMYYEWAGHNLNITKTKLVTDVLAAANQTDNILNGKVSNLTTSNVNKIELVTKAGTAISSPYVTVNSDYSLTVNYPDAGSKVFYVKITYNSSKNTVIVPILVNVTDVQDSVYVLDYGLSVDLTGKNAKGISELTKNDTLSVPGRDTSSSFLAIGNGGSYTPNEITFNQDADGVIDADYGRFTLSGQTLTFTPTAFLEGFSSVELAVNVYETDTPSKITGTLNINKEVEMYKKVVTLPANVVYYEDDFPAITYTQNSESYVNTIEKVGDSSDKTQSVDQDENYGHDGTYAGDAEDQYSAGSLTKITINQSGVAASFQFTGTGFELIGRTNATDSATLVVRVRDASGNLLKTIPVITEFDNEDDSGSEAIYQVPVIRVDDLSTTAATYTVEISGTPARDFNNVVDGVPAIIPTILYIDGLRIFQPVEGSQDEETVNGEDKNPEDLYNENEQNAQFIELRDQIVDGTVAVVSYTESDGINVSTATSTWTENLSGESVDGLEFNQVNSVEDYLMQGPNNEVYMTGTYDNAALVFYVKETGTGTHDLQIALRAIDEDLFLSGIEGAPKATVRVGAYANGTYTWTDVVTEYTSSTEQYYTIDYKNCYYDESKGAYQVVVRVDEGMVSYSSLKLTGLELVSIAGDSTDLYYVNGVLSKYVEQFPEDTDASAQNYEAVDAAAYVNFRSVKDQMASTLLTSEYEPEVTEPTEPETTEPEEEDQNPGKDKPGKGKGNGKGDGPIYTNPGFKPGKGGASGDSKDLRDEVVEELIDFLKGKGGN